MVDSCGRTVRTIPNSSNQYRSLVILRWDMNVNMDLCSCVMGSKSEKYAVLELIYSRRICMLLSFPYIPQSNDVQQ